jgi:Tol biopolymer transport system component
MTPRTAIPVAALALALCISPAAEAAFPGDNGELAVVQDRDLGFVHPPDPAIDYLPGTKNASLLGPAFSADGRRLVMTKATPRCGGCLVVARADGSHRKVIASSSRFNYGDAAFSRTGKRLVMIRRGAGQDLALLNLKAGGKPQLITRTPGVIERDPTFSVDGRIYFAAGPKGDNTDLFSIKADGSDLRQLTATPAIAEGQPDSSPDGRRLAFSAAGSIFAMDSDGQNVTAIRKATSGGGLTLTFDSPVYSPDGRAIAFLSIGDVGVRRSQDLEAVPLVPGGPAGELAGDPLGVSLSSPAWQPLP